MNFSMANWQPISDAPKDGTLLRLLVEFEENSLDDCDSSEPQATVGCNFLANNGEDEWFFAGWDWSHDQFTSGKGRVVGWMPLLEPGEDEFLKGRMKNSGMFSVLELMNGTPMDAFRTHVGVKDLATFEEWLVMKRLEYIKLQARFEVEERTDDELYDWAIAHNAVFSEAHINFKRAIESEKTAVSAAETRIKELESDLEIIKKAAIAVVEEEMSNVSVHPCDEHSEDVKARGMQPMYRELWGLVK